MLLSLIAALSLAAPGPNLPPVYIPKHPDLVVPEPVFNKNTTLAASKQVAAYIESAISNAPQDHKDLITFVGIAGSIYINAHRAEIMDCTDKRGNKYGPGMADPYCVWPRPMADDWIGCMALQFAGEQAFKQFHLSSLTDDDTVFIWIDKNYDSVVKEKGGEWFLRQLNGIPTLGAACEKIVQDEVPKGDLTASLGGDVHG